MAAKLFIPAASDKTPQRHIGLAVSTSLFVVNKNAQVITDTPDDPHLVISGSHASFANVVPFASLNYPYLNLYHISTGPTDFSTAPGVKCYGFKPYTEDNIKRLVPADIDIDAFDLPNHSTLNLLDVPGYWVPLFDPRTGDHEITFPTAAEIAKRSNADGAHDFELYSGNSLVYTEGCSHILVVIATAAVDTPISSSSSSSSGPTQHNSLILGSLTA